MHVNKIASKVEYFLLQPVLMFLERGDMLELGDGVFQRAFSTSATCLNRLPSFEVGGSPFFKFFYVQVDCGELRRAKSAEVFLFDTTSVPLDKSKVDSGF